MRNYSQLTREQRYQISALFNTGHSVTEIAKEIGKHKSTISRELRRNGSKQTYCPKRASKLANVRHKLKPKYRINPLIWEMIKELLQKKWSPEQISGRLKRDQVFNISHETIYQYIYADKKHGGSLYKYLRRKKKYGHRIGGKSPRGQIPHRVSIRERPSVVDKKERIGDWEADTIIGKGHKQAIVTLVDRVAKIVRIAKVENKTAEGVKNAIITLLRPYKGLIHTITADNGKEFAQHQEIAQKLDTDFYFATPYSSWERGLNENTNGLIRQYFPKGTSFTELTDKDMEKVMDDLNSRPRKTLGFRTPNEVFYEHLVALH
ncbi:IS30 family transposase [Acinetobacter sp. YH12119]|uniref:IS30 family transposase n=1 Tax=Acinetobacter sp. YH12119 TaxID=2601106 RepID=UPI0015D237AA|nr:IS30 family transposase [Acinetobacter sp. YH12119]